MSVGAHLSQYAAMSDVVINSQTDICMCKIVCQ